MKPRYPAHRFLLLFWLPPVPARNAPGAPQLADADHRHAGRDCAPVLDN